MAKQPTILIVDDHPIMRIGIVQLVKSSNKYQVVGEAGSVSEAVVMINDLKPDLVLTDISLPDRTGLDLIKEISGTPMLAISMHNEEVYAERVMKAGGKGYIMKDKAPEQLLTAIEKVLAGGVYFSEAIIATLINSLSTPQSAKPSVSTLTDRELEIFRLFGEGHVSKEISAQLGISSRTVDAHRTHIKEKLGHRDAADFLRSAVRWIETGEL